MQPYFMPYIGYFQLIKSSDIFVVFDDVNYIKKGWINRNNILVNGKINQFTIPLIGASQNKKICELELSIDGNWRANLFKTLQQNYKKSENYKEIIDLMEDIIYYKDNNLSKFLLNSLIKVISYLDIQTKIIETSSIYDNTELKGEIRIVDICKKLGATTYNNPIGGVELYDKNHFFKEGITLNFLRTKKTNYNQVNTYGHFEPYLSIIDVMMNVDKASLKLMLNEFELI